MPQANLERAPSGWRKMSARYKIQRRTIQKKIGDAP